MPLTSQKIINAPVNVTASRSLNTTYTNPRSTDQILVLMTVRCVTTVAGGSAIAQAFADSLAVPTTIASGRVGLTSGLLNEDNSFQLSFIVPVGKNYRINSTVVNGTVAIGEWFEIFM